MNIIKIGLVLLTGAGFGFGVDKLADTEMFPKDYDGYGHMEDDGYYGHMGGGCHGDGDFLEHMLDELSDEELLLVQGKIDELLIEYSITLEELNDDYEVRYDFMNDLMDFLEENEIDYHNHGGNHDHDDHDDEGGWHGGMGMH
jgi:hypothetical protein